MSENNSINRRDFVKSATVAGAGLLLANSLNISAQSNLKKRYAIIGTGHRATGMCGDDRLRDVIFKNAQVPDYLKLPSARAGGMSCLTGIAARTSIEKARPLQISELIRL